MHNDLTLRSWRPDGDGYYTSAMIQTRSEVYADFALRIAGPADGRLEASIDGAAYKPCRYADGFWWYCWSGSLEGSHHMVVVVRSSAEERSPEPDRKHSEVL
jgi:hypothetical protein